MKKKNADTDWLAEQADHIRTLERKTIENILEIGNILIKVKEVLAYGEFGRWCKEELKWSQSYADKLMGLARTYSGSESIPDLSMSHLVALSPLDEAVRAGVAAFVEEKEATVEETKALVKKLQDEKANLESTLEERRNQFGKALDEVRAELEEAKRAKVKEVVPEDYEVIKEQNQSLWDENGKLQRRCNKLLMELEGEAGTSVSPPEDYEAIKKENQKLQKEVGDLSARLRDLTEQLKTTDLAAQLQEENKRLRAENTALREENDQLKKKLSKKAA